jgi:hypothetical protein
VFVLSAASRFDEFDWDDVNRELADEKRSQIGESDRASGEDIQEYDQFGVEEEHMVERPTSEGMRAATGSFGRDHLERVSMHPSASSVDRVDLHEDDIVKLVNLDFEDYQGTSEYDVGPEKEDVTGIVRSIDDAIDNLDLVEQATVEASPEEDVEFRRQGFLTEQMIRGSGGEFDLNRAERGKTVDTDYFFPEPKYENFGDTYPFVGNVAGTGSIQVTMRPKIYDEEHGDSVDVDRWISEFKGGQEDVGMSALSPLLYGPFMTSPVIDYRTAGETGEGEKRFEPVIEVVNGRDLAYDQSFMTPWDRQGRENRDDPGDYVTENSKAGFSPSLAAIQSIEEDQDFDASSEMNFAEVEASKVKVVEDEEYDQEADYDTLDEELEFMNSDDMALVRIGRRDWDLNGKDSIKPMKEVVEDEMFGGQVLAFERDGETIEKQVVVDYQDEDIFPDMTDEDFKEAVKGLYQADSTAVWEPWRLRPGDMAMEYRDVGNNPYRDEAIATVVGAFRTWRDIQDFASNELGLTNENAKDLRLGVDGFKADHENDENYEQQMGMDYTLNEDEDITLQDAWLGKGMEEGLIDIIAEGVGEMSQGEVYSAEQYRENMEELLENSLTPGEMIAKHHGVDLEGEILYEPEDIVVGAKNEQYAES